MLRRPPLLASGFLVAGLAILCGLGLWQLERLEWKRAILDAVEAEKLADPHQRSFQFSYLTSENFYKRGFVAGTFDHAHEIALGPRVYDKEVGYEIYTPLYLKTGQAVLVKRGWVPEELKNFLARSEPAIEVSISGMIAPSPKPNFFTPENDLGRGNYFRIDLKDLEQQTGKSFAPVILWAQEEGGEAGEIVVLQPYHAIPNDHFQYALFWFSMAAALLVVFYFRFISSR